MARPTNLSKMSQAAQGASGEGKPIKKMEAVRRALKKLGDEAKPLQIQAFVKNEFSIDMTPTVISTYKGTILRKGSNGDGRSHARANGKASPMAPPRKELETIRIEDLKTLKEMAERIGADKVGRLAEMLTK